MSNTVSVILVEPQMGANIGAVARAMLNLGYTDLRLVTPRDGWPNEEADRNSAGALEAMPDVQVFESLDDALKGFHTVWGTTARSRDMVKPVFTPHGAGANLANCDFEQNVALVFGGERAGLTNDHLALCHGVINIPANEAFSSLNLAQAVLLVLWEVFKNAGVYKTVANKSKPELATHDKLDEFCDRLEGALEEGDFFKAKDLRPQMVRNIRNMFMRSQLTDQEVRTLHGIVSALLGADNKKEA